ncbi:hypothetical protein P7C70_g8289, partial [Phenoliferia sp. Uapishka_3]
MTGALKKALGPQRSNPRKLRDLNPGEGYKEAMSYEKRNETGSLKRGFRGTDAEALALLSAAPAPLKARRKAASDKTAAPIGRPSTAERSAPPKDPKALLLAKRSPVRPKNSSSKAGRASQGRNVVPDEYEAPSAPAIRFSDEEDTSDSETELVALSADERLADSEAEPDTDIESVAGSRAESVAESLVGSPASPGPDRFAPSSPSASPSVRRDADGDNQWPAGTPDSDDRSSESQFELTQGARTPSPSMSPVTSPVRLLSCLARSVHGVYPSLLYSQVKSKPKAKPKPKASPVKPNRKAKPAGRSTSPTKLSDKERKAGALAIVQLRALKAKTARAKAKAKAKEATPINPNTKTKRATASPFKGGITAGSDADLARSSPLRKPSKSRKGEVEAGLSPLKKKSGKSGKSEKRLANEALYGGTSFPAITDADLPSQDRKRTSKKERGMLRSSGGEGSGKRGQFTVADMDTFEKATYLKMCSEIRIRLICAGRPWASAGDLVSEVNDLLARARRDLKVDITWHAGFQAQV